MLPTDYSNPNAATIAYRITLVSNAFATAPTVLRLSRAKRNANCLHTPTAP